MREKDEEGEDSGCKQIRLFILSNYSVIPEHVHVVLRIVLALYIYVIFIHLILDHTRMCGDKVPRVPRGRNLKVGTESGFDLSSGEHVK